MTTDVRLRWLRIAALVMMVFAISGCTTGSDASAPQGGDFEFVSPGGKVVFEYQAGEREGIGELAGPAVTGDGRISTADYAGQVLVLNFWGSWCAPCRGESAFLDTAFADTKVAGVKFLGINVRDDKAAAADYDAARQTPYSSIFDKSMRTLAAIRGFPTASIPSTIILDRNQQVAYIHLGAFNGPADLVAAIKKVADERPSSSPGSAGSGSATPTS